MACKMLLEKSTSQRRLDYCLHAAPCRPMTDALDQRVCVTRLMSRDNITLFNRTHVHVKQLRRSSVDAASLDVQKKAEPALSIISSFPQSLCPCHSLLAAGHALHLLLDDQLAKVVLSFLQTSISGLGVRRERGPFLLLRSSVLVDGEGGADDCTGSQDAADQSYNSDCFSSNNDCFSSDSDCFLHRLSQRFDAI